MEGLKTKRKAKYKSQKDKKEIDSLLNDSPDHTYDPTKVIENSEESNNVYTT